MKTRYERIVIFVFIGFCSVLLPCHSAFAAKVTEIRFWSAPDHARVVLDLTEPIQFEISSQENPPQLHLELKDVSLSTSRRSWEANDPFLTKISITDLKKKRVKLVFHQKKPLNANVFLLKPYQDKPHRLVIDLIDLTQEKKDQEEREKQKEIKQKETKIVVIDPGQAFGTGSHPTTQLCLAYLLDEEPHGLLDLGCGSGVLGIAAALLGFDPVEAFDLDPLAVEATAANARANGVELAIRLLDVLAEPLPRAELAAANIALAEIESLAERIPASRLITSGYLASERPDARGWQHAGRSELDGWAADVFERL